MAPVTTPFVGLARALGAGLGSMELRGIDREYQRQGDDYNKTLAEAMKMYGTDPQAAIARLGQNPDFAEPAVKMQMDYQTQQAQMARDNARYAQQDAQRADDQAFRRDMLQTQIEARQQQAEADRALREQLAQLAAANRGGGSTPYYQALPTKDGYVTFDTRSGQYVKSDINGNPVVPGTLDPVLQGEIAGAKTAATTEAEITTKREQNMAGIGDIIARARGILMSGKPTQSAIGTVADAGGRIFGMTPEGAPEAEQLRVLGGSLISKMPRMEGPQSNFDVQNYREMAGQVGDSTLPIERRLAALAEVERLYAKYANQPAQPSGASGSWEDGATISTDEEYDALPSGATFVGPDGVTRRKP